MTKQLSLLPTTTSDEKWIEYLDAATEEECGIGVTWVEVVATMAPISQTYKDIVENAFEIMMADEALTESQRLEAVDYMASAGEFDDADDAEYDDWNNSFKARNDFDLTPSKYGKWSNTVPLKVVVDSFTIKLPHLDVHVTTEKEGHYSRVNKAKCIDRVTGNNITEQVQNTLRITPAPVGKGQDSSYNGSSINLLLILGFIKSFKPCVE